MSKPTIERTKRISADELAPLARLAVKRAIASRNGLAELTLAQVEKVSGGVRPVTKEDPFVLSGANPKFPDPTEAVKV